MSPVDCEALVDQIPQRLVFDIVGRWDFSQKMDSQTAEENVLARADIVFFTMPNNGAVFSVGSISWSGSLSHNNYQNNVSQITDNVLKRFLDPKPFGM